MTKTEKQTRSIITSASSKFFPSLLNFIGSIKKNYPSHPHIYVYDLGLFPTYRAEIKAIEGVTLLDMPHFSPFWRKCYTWKTYIFNNPFTDTTLYLDAGNEILRPLDSLFDQIEKDGYLAVEQTTKSKTIIPNDYISLFNIPQETLERNAITAGIFGFDIRNESVKNLISRLHDASLAGLCLGYSKAELWKNKKPNKTFFIRDCDQFRHDTTLLTILLYTLVPNLKAADAHKFGNERDSSANSEQFIWNLRMNYDSLSHTSRRLVSSTAAWPAAVNRAVLAAFYALKKTNKTAKAVLLSRNPFAFSFGQELNATMDSFHDYPGGAEKAFSNVRLYHHEKALICTEFIKKNAKSDRVILDAGAGTGPYSKIASPLYKHVYAYEYNEDELNRAKTNLKSARNVDFGAVDLKAVPLADNSVDVFLCSEVLEHIPDEHLAAAELFRVLKPGGKALISMPNKDSIFYKRITKLTQHLIDKKKAGEELPYAEWERVRHVSFGSKDIERIATDAGFKVTARHGANLIPLPTSARKLMMKRIPPAFHLWTKLERIAASLFPQYCSFYFIEVRK